MYSTRLKLLPSYLFITLDRRRKELEEKGMKIINFSVGDPDLPTPKHIRDKLKEAVEDFSTHKYPFGGGTKEFREAVASWYKARFKVQLDPEKEIYTLIGSKEGIGHLPLAFVDPGDIVLVPEPGYPVYNSSTILSLGKPYYLPLKIEKDFLPDLETIPSTVLGKTKLLFLNYPNNPTSACPENIAEFFEKVVYLAKRHNFVVAHDAAYSEIYYPDKWKTPPISFLAVKGAKDVGVEFHSLSKTFNMTGWRIGFVCGNRDIIAGIAKVKDNYDSGVFTAIQYAGIAALTGPQDCVAELREVYMRRRDAMLRCFRSLGLEVYEPKATFYLWVRVPNGYTSENFAEKLLSDCGIMATPGSGFGPSGEGFLRFSLTVEDKKIEEAIELLSKLKF